LKAHSSQRPAVGQPERQQYERCALDVALDALDNALNGLIDTYAQRLHDALDEACGRLLKGADQPSVGGVPASVIVTITLEELLAKAGLGETSDGGQ
jgi:hypothetical protein